jgi:hypothetical protein
MVNKTQADKMAECRRETRKHIDDVRHYIYMLIDAMDKRAFEHDRSKLDEPELPLFAEMTPKLAKLDYGSKEYNESLKVLKPALDHHHAKNRHHPEHFPDSISGMNLIDLLEMLCDWKAASERQHNGNLLKSIETAAERFELPEMLVSVFKNTVDLFENAKE